MPDARTPATPRLLTRTELDALARPPRAEVLAAIEAADAALAAGGVDDPLARAAVATAVRAVTRWERQFAGFVDGFGAFLAAIQEWLLTEHGLDGLAAAQRHDRWVVHVMSSDFREHEAAELERGHGDEVEGVLTAGGPDVVANAMAIWGELESAWRKAHDITRDLLAAWLSHVYRAHGVDALEACLRHCADRTLLGWMPIDLARPPQDRVAQWSRMMLGNFARITVDEDDDAFTITQDPCGTCTRQLRDGVYGPPLSLAIVTERHPVTWGRGDVPVYRAHVPVFHQLLPRERIGIEWPEVRCPEGLGTGPCTLRLLKEAGA